MTDNKVNGIVIKENPDWLKLNHTLEGHKGPIGKIAWSPNGKIIATPSDDTTIKIWNADTGKLIRTLKEHNARVIDVDWSPSTKMLAASSDDNTISIWDTQTYDRIRVLDRHQGGVRVVKWSPDGTKLVTASNDNKIMQWTFGDDGSVLCEEFPNITCFDMLWTADQKTIFILSKHKIVLLDSRSLNVVKELPTHVPAMCFDLSVNNKYLATGSYNGSINLWNVDEWRISRTLEGHTAVVNSVSFSPDNNFIASKSKDGTVRLWLLDKWECVEVLSEPNPHFQFAGIAFSSNRNALATLNDRDMAVRIWEVASIQSTKSVDVTLRPITIDIKVGKPSLKVTPPPKTIHYTSAKVILVGESDVGKSCLSMRLAEDRYPNDDELGTTHGMRFWSMNAVDLHPSAKPPKNHKREVVLWDFGGQDEYQLVHQMFLQDTTLALVLIDPTRGQVAFNEAKDWNKRLEKHLESKKAVKLLIGAKVDRNGKLIDLNAINELKTECGFTEFLDISAKTERNINKLRKMIADVLNWDKIVNTSRPELFQRIRDEIDVRRKKKQIVLTLDTLKRAIKKSAKKLYEEAAVEAVSDQLATQGVIVRTKLTSGDETLVLDLTVIERYAGSLILAARNNLRGVPVLEERLLSSTKTIPLPIMTKRERLSPTKERIVLECIVELMIQHGICFRHGGLLVFPTLFPVGVSDDENLPHSVSLYYDFTGAIDNIYASLVSKLMVSEEFGEGRLRSGSVEFERPRQGVCGVRQIKRTGGMSHMDLFFSDKTKPSRKDLFTRFVEEHLRIHGVDICEHQAIKCKCGEKISERIVQTRIFAGEKDVVCPICEKKTLIGEGVERIRERNPKTDAKMVALRRTIDAKLSEDIESIKKVVAGKVHTVKNGEMIRILHLSDLHFMGRTNPETRVNQLLQDIRRKDEDYPAIEAIEYLVVSGDVTDKGKDIGFDKARVFVESLVSELYLTNHRCIFVPGNHDVQDRTDAYEERESEDGKTVKVRHPINFPRRFERFSEGFYHPLLQKEYPLKYGDQGIPYLFPSTGIQFLTLNSAWEIDKNGRNKASIHTDAVAGVIARADDERKRAIESGDLRKTQQILRIGVWHHPVAGPDAMKDIGFMTQLQKAEMRLCLHGDVHKVKTELFGYRQPGINVEVLGAGSFGSGAEGRPESVPMLYNMLEITVDIQTKKHTSIRVHTREKKEDGTAWQGYHAWTNPKGGGRLSYFDIDLL